MVYFLLKVTRQHRWKEVMTDTTTRLELTS